MFSPGAQLMKQPPFYLFNGYSWFKRPIFGKQSLTNQRIWCWSKTGLAVDDIHVLQLPISFESRLAPSLFRGISVLRKIITSAGA